MRRRVHEQPAEYGWVQSMLRERGHAGHRDDESLGLMMESDVLRTALYTFLLGGLACLTAYFAYRVANGEGRRVFLVTAALAAFMTCGALATRGRTLLRLLFSIAGLCAFALLVDQLVYFHWHKRVDRIMTSLRQGVEPDSPDGFMTPSPTSFRIQPGRDVVLEFEPPALAWTYHLDAASPAGHAVVATWYRILGRVVRAGNLDEVARTVLRPRQVYAVSVRSPGDWGPACFADDGRGGMVSIDTWRGPRPL